MKLKDIVSTAIISSLFLGCTASKQFKADDNFKWTVAYRSSCDVNEVYKFGWDKTKSYIVKKYLNMAYKAIADKNPKYREAYKRFEKSFGWDGKLTEEDKKILSKELWKLDSFPYNTIIEPNEILNYISGNEKGIISLKN